MRASSVGWAVNTGSTFFAANMQQIVGAKAIVFPISGVI